MARFLITVLGSWKQNCDCISIYGINIICSKKLHKKFIYHKVKRF